MDEEDRLETVVPLPPSMPPRWLKELLHGFLEPISVWLLPIQWLAVGGLDVSTRPPKVDIWLLLCVITGVLEPVLIPVVIEFLILVRS